jgi:uridine phosphorylase
MKDHSIFEYDLASEPLCVPGPIIACQCVPEICVITYFRDAVKGLLTSGKIIPKLRLQMDGLDIPIYTIHLHQVVVGLALGALGAPASAICLEQLAARGCKTCLICGSAGTLQPMDVGHLIVPNEALRDEGLSHHYQPFSKTITCDDSIVLHLCNELKHRGIDFSSGKIWTTDALYRETRNIVTKRQIERCIAVDMETSAYLAVARFLNVRLGSLLHVSDDLSGECYNARATHDMASVRADLLTLTLEIAASFKNLSLPQNIAT